MKMKLTKEQVVHQVAAARGRSHLGGVEDAAIVALDDELQALRKVADAADRYRRCSDLGDRWHELYRELGAALKETGR